MANSIFFFSEGVVPKNLPPAINKCYVFLTSRPINIPPKWTKKIIIGDRERERTLSVILLYYQFWIKVKSLLLPFFWPLFQSWKQSYFAALELDSLFVEVLKIIERRKINYHDLDLLVLLRKNCFAHQKNFFIFFAMLVLPRISKSE